MAESSMYHSEKNYSHFRNDNILHIKTCLQSAHFYKHEDELPDFLTSTCLLGTLSYSHKNLSKCPNRLIVCNNTIKQFRISGKKSIAECDCFLYLPLSICTPWFQKMQGTCLRTSEWRAEHWQNPRTCDRRRLWRSSPWRCTSAGCCPLQTSPTVGINHDSISSDNEIGQYSTVGINHDSMSDDLTIWVVTMS